MTEAQRAQFLAMRKALDGFVSKIVDIPSEINDNMAVIRPWKEAAYNVGDVRIYDGIPYKCVQAHDSTGNTGWNPPATPSLWMQYHGTSKETARNWVAPAGAHDMYRAGEFMIWMDGTIYRCTSDTIYSPTDYAAAWAKEDDHA